MPFVTFRVKKLSLTSNMDTSVLQNMQLQEDPLVIAREALFNSSLLPSQVEHFQ